jgi:hypothetical protein
MTRRLSGLVGAELLLEDGVAPESEDGLDEVKEGTVGGVGCSVGCSGQVGSADCASEELVSEELVGGEVALTELEVLLSGDDAGRACDVVLICCLFEACGVIAP